MDDVRAGRAKASDVDDYVDRWSDDPNPFGLKLHQFLGLTWAEYMSWVVSGALPPTDKA